MAEGGARVSLKGHPRQRRRLLYDRAGAWLPCSLGVPTEQLAARPLETDLEARNAAPAPLIGPQIALGEPYMASRPSLEEGHIAPAALSAMETFHAAIVREVQEAIQRDAVVVVGMAQNPHVRNVRKALDEAGIAYTYLEYGSYFSKWRERLAIKLWSGWPTFPQVFVRGVLIGGEILTKAAIADGSLRSSLGTLRQPVTA